MGLVDLVPLVEREAIREQTAASVDGLDQGAPGAISIANSDLASLPALERGAPQRPAARGADDGVDTARDPVVYPWTKARLIGLSPSSPFCLLLSYYGRVRDGTHATGDGDVEIVERGLKASSTPHERRTYHRAVAREGHRHRVSGGTTC